MSKPHENHTDPFIELQHQSLNEYAQDWVDRYKNIQIKRVVLYRYDTDPYDLIISNARKRTGSLSKRISKDSHPVQYAIVFEISNCGEKLYSYSKEYLDYPSNIEYVSQKAINGPQIKNLLPIPIPEDPQDIACIEFMKDCKQAYSYDSYNRPHPFLNSAFRNKVYKSPPVWDFRKEWVFDYLRPDDNLRSNILADKPFLILYDSEISIEKKADIQNETTESNLEDFPPNVIDLMNKARAEIELIYKAIKEGVGFNNVGEKYDEARMEDALSYFEEYKDKFKIIKKEDLQNTKIYNISTAPHRKVRGELLRTLVERRNLGRYAYGKLFGEYQKQKKQL